MTEREQPRAEAADPLIGSTLAERYRILSLLGRGGMGSVYRAQHVHMRKTVALKVLHRELTFREEVVKRFEREAIAAARIDHPNVAVATDFGRLEDGAFYLVLEYVPGESLHATLRHGSLELRRALLIAEQVARALEAAHAAGIVHRDLKPDNVMLVPREANSEQVKVLDFGIAKVQASDTSGAGTQLTQVGTVFGTPHYMAPEQAAGRAVDHRADIYALGLILHEMLTARRTFDADDMIVLLTKQLAEPAPPLPESVPAVVRQLVASMLEKDPERRPGSAHEVAKGLEQALQHQTSVDARTIADRTVTEVTAGAAGPPSADAGRAGAGVALQQRPGGRLNSVRKLVNDRFSGRVPMWAIAVATLLGLGALLVFMSRTGIDNGRSAGGAVATAEPGGERQVGDLGENEDADAEPDLSSLDPELQRVISAARGGSVEALYALEQRSPATRTKHEWLALAQGRLRRRQLDEALGAFERALAADATLAENATMLAGLRYFAEKETTSDRVMEFAAAHLGSSGADLLFHIWFSTSRVTRTTQRARELLDEDRVSRRWSAALRVALDLRKAQACEDYRQLLARAKAVADERSLGPLRELMKTKGCGVDREQDCWSCLRSGDELKDTIAQVRMRKAPLFRSRRFR